MVGISINTFTVYKIDSTGNSTQCLVITYMEKESEKE